MGTELFGSGACICGERKGPEPLASPDNMEGIREGNDHVFVFRVYWAADTSTSKADIPKKAKEMLGIKVES
jgi:hypothetical protein